MIRLPAVRAQLLYHTDSVESTSKCRIWLCTHACLYTILTLWSQLQNDSNGNVVIGNIYHTDSVESTSKSLSKANAAATSYTILTLWSQLQNA